MQRLQAPRRLLPAVRRQVYTYGYVQWVHECNRSW